MQLHELDGLIRWNGLIFCSCVLVFSRQWWWCYFNWKRLKVYVTWSAESWLHYGVPLWWFCHFIYFSWYWCAFLFQCSVFPANDFLHHSHISVIQCAQWFFSTARALIVIKVQWIHPYTPHCSNILLRSSIQYLCYSCLLREEERSTKMCFAITIRADWIRRVRSVFFYLGYPH